MHFITLKAILLYKWNTLTKIFPSSNNWIKTIFKYSIKMRIIDKSCLKIKLLSEIDLMCKIIYLWVVQ